MKRKLILAGSIVEGISVAYLIFANVSQSVARYHGEPEIVQIDSVVYTPPPPKMLYVINIDSMSMEEGIIQRNENLSAILTRYNISAQTIYEIGKLSGDSFDVRRLQSTKPYTIIHQKDLLKTAKAFLYHPNKIDYTMLEVQAFPPARTLISGSGKMDNP